MALQLLITVPVACQSQTSLHDVNIYVWVSLPSEPEPLHRTWMAVHAVLTYAAEVISVSLLAQLLCLQVCAGETKVCLGAECLKYQQFFLIGIKTRICVDLLR